MCENIFTRKRDLTRHNTTEHGTGAWNGEELLKFHCSSVHWEGVDQFDYCETQAVTEDCLSKHHMTVHE